MGKQPNPATRALDSFETSLNDLKIILSSITPAMARRLHPRLEALARDLLGSLAAMPAKAKSIIGVMDPLVEIMAESCANLATTKRSQYLRAFEEQIELLERTIGDIDSIKSPRTVFDPALPKTVGRLVAMALLAQQRLPLEAVGQMYGSGCYAIYYTGANALYRPISKTETPIYVGKADPKEIEAASPKEQGCGLTKRLDDHKRMILQVAHWAAIHSVPEYSTLSINDFEYRRIVVATNAQLVAEQYLIRFFKPIWNNQCDVCWGISKHGDSPHTRSNKRSPWDVLHPGRAWALSSKLANSKEPEAIIRDIREHFVAYPPYGDTRTIMDAFMEEFRQTPVEQGRADAPDEKTDG